MSSRKTASPKSHARQLIRWYIDNFSAGLALAAYEAGPLKFLERTALGQCDALTLTTGRLIST